MFSFQSPLSSCSTTGSCGSLATKCVQLSSQKTVCVNPGKSLNYNATTSTTSHNIEVVHKTYKLTKQSPTFDSWPELKRMCASAYILDFCSDAMLLNIRLFFCVLVLNWRKIEIIVIFSLWIRQNIRTYMYQVSKTSSHKL